MRRTRIGASIARDVEGHGGDLRCDLCASGARRSATLPRPWRAHIGAAHARRKRAARRQALRRGEGAAEAAARRRRVRSIPCGWRGGLAWRTVAKCRFSRPAAAFSEPPWNTFATKAPPWRQHARSANSSASSASATMRIWSVAPWPVVFGAMSDSTRSALPPSSSPSRAGIAGSAKSPWMNRRAGDRVDRQQVERDHARRAARHAPPGSSRPAPRRGRAPARRGGSAGSGRPARSA